MTQTAKLALKVAFATACAAALAGAVQAQPATGGGSATLYELPNFQGRSVTVYRGADNLQDSNFNDMAQSAHFDGDWTVCSDAGLRGNCQTLSGDVPNLSRYGLDRMVSSLRKGAAYGDSGGSGYGRDPGVGDTRAPGDRPGLPDQRGYGDNRGFGDDRAYDNRWQGANGVPGRSVVFFARPKQDGQDIAAFNRGAADWFCRRQGLGAAVYYDTSYRGRGFRFSGGGFSMNAPVLRDVVCRK
ncbi:MAG TPA: beta/gamma crystallin-related protein [Caulobacteraceae bacterium]